MYDESESGRSHNVAATLLSHNSKSSYKNSTTIEGLLWKCLYKNSKDE
jgi:hypothetical protein